MSGLARTGAAMSDGSGDYALAFSTASAVRRDASPQLVTAELRNDSVSPLFLAAVEAAEEAILNSLCMAEDMTGHRQRQVKALPLEAIRILAVRRRNRGRSGDAV